MQPLEPWQPLTQGGAVSCELPYAIRTVRRHFLPSCAPPGAETCIPLKVSHTIPSSSWEDKPYKTRHFTELLDEFSQDILGQLLNDPFLTEKNEAMEVELSPASPAPLIQAEHSYSLCGDSRPQSPLTHISADDTFNEGNEGTEQN
uniref:Cyclic AMP-responsive element-binding protein 3-like protein 2 n=1 Tax=Sphaerodactylus townsendi TaxID=933632 RepID=A0ACB8FMP3_9SAUR